MTHRRLRLAAALALLAAACGEAARDGGGPAMEVANERLAGLEPVDANVEAEPLTWSDLLPTDELDALARLNAGEADPSLMGRFLGESPVEGQFGTFNVVEDLDGAVVRMPGYILPLDYASRGEAREFLLLPYHGACIHYPPPPPNQIVYLKSPAPIRFDALWEPVWVEGRMEIERVDTELAAAAYSMVVRSVVDYRVAD